jgi:long-chain acyl-CoA synthetase
MLYDKWRQVAQRHRDRLALRSLGENRQWTFGELAELAESLPPSEEPVVFPRGRSSEFILETLRGWRDRRVVCPLEDNQAQPDLKDLPPEISHIKLTSGTTGAPRCVAFTESQLAADPRNIVATMRLSVDSPNLGVISMAHSYGFANLVLPLALHGIPLVIAPSPLPEIVGGALSAGSNWTLPAVPALWQTWLDTVDFSNRVQTAISAGAPLPIQLEEAVFKKHKLKIHNFLGSSECGGVAYDRTETPRDDPSFVGLPLENVKVSTADDSRLRVEGAAVGSTYWPEASASLTDGRFELNDLAEIRNGSIHLQGSVGDRINIAGRKVLPESIERALLQHAAVKECLVFGVPSSLAERNEEIVAVIVGAQEIRLKLQRHLLTLLPAWQVPRHWRFVDSLSANARGKISRADWRERFRAADEKK